MSKPSIFFTIFTLVMVPILASLLFTVNENRETIKVLKKQLSNLESQLSSGGGGTGSDIQRKLDDVSSQIGVLNRDLKANDVKARVEDITRQLASQAKMLEETVKELERLK